MNDWWKKSVVYQIYPMSFCDSNGDGMGDINGITSKLDYIKLLGVDVIWISPVYDSPRDDNGYDIRDYRKIAEDFGTMADFEHMLEEAHKRGLKIVMDLVVNHTSDEHKWFVESKSSKDNAYRDYYIWREGRNGAEPNNWGSFFSGSAWKYDDATDMYFLHLFSKKQPDLNWDNPKVRDSVFDMMTWWCDKGIDGFRMDVINLISKVEGLPDGELNGAYGINGDGSPYFVDGPHVHEYLQEMNSRVLSKYDLITVGECVGVTVDEAKRFASLDGKELNMVFQFEHMGVDGSDEGTKWTEKKIKLSEMKKVLTKWQTELYGKAWNSLYWGNHDQARSVSRYGCDSPKWRETSAKMLATCLHMMQGTPYVYQGDELGMTNMVFRDISDFRDIESINAYNEYTQAGKCDPETMLRYISYKGRDNARTPVQWDDSLNAGFSTGSPWIGVNPNYTQINAKDQVAREDSVFNYYRKLIALRRTEPLITDGRYVVLYPEDDNIYAYLRQGEDGALLVICNFTDKEQRFTLPANVSFKTSQALICNYEPNALKTDNVIRPYESVVYKLS